LSRRVVIRGAFGEHEVQRYAHVDLHRLYAPQPLQQEEPGSDNERHRADEDADGDALLSDEQHPAPSALAVEEVLAAAQQQAGAMLALAQQEAEQLRRTAYEQGFARGCEEGKEQAKQELLPALVAFAQVGQSLIVLEEQLIERFTPQLVRFALDIAEKVVGKAVEEDPHIVAAVLERARAELPQARTIRVWLHPLDYRALTECRPDLVQIGEKGGRTVEVFSTEEVERGGCRVETEMGVVDATIPVQMQEIRRQMLD
jgi:flagellar assembly protein FliH